jgi:heme/copper-type cytochrome/quinol oxidase subunit 2
MEEKNMPMQDSANDDKNETVDLQHAIEKLVDEETAVLSHQEKLSSDVTEETAGKKAAASSATQGQSQVSDWFFTFMCMNIPVAGWIYLMCLAFNRRHTERRNFARAYLFYKLVFFTVALVIILILGVAAMNLLDQLLAYMQML